jgi:diguanylate cyclase (GGDEF)-like protein/PAS domain S-box-containing protein
MKILRNIRSKIWACVSVALLSYLFATLATTWVNTKTQISLTHVQEVDLPLSSKGILVHSLFNAQSEDYENGLLTGEQGEIKQANMSHDQIARLLDELVELVGASHTDDYPGILSLRDDYNEYFTLASQYYMEAVKKDDIFSARQEIHQLGKLRGGLDAKFQEVSEMLQSMIVLSLEQNNKRIDFYTRLLHVFFVLILVVTTIVINWLANTQLISPLRNIKKMISDFSRGRTVQKPQGNPEGDEIKELASSFWQMTRELKHITVSRDYVDNIINNMSDSLIILNPNLTIGTANHATLGLLRTSKENLENRPFRDVFSHPEEAMVNSLFKGFNEGKTVNNIEALYIDNDKQAIPVLFSASALYLPDGTLQGISCLARDISELKEQRDELEFLANFDQLTGLPNRNLFFDRLTLTTNEARRYGHLFALLYLDLDLFKPLNDEYGHEAGDLALQEVARRLQKVVRDTDTVSRVGGDEFAILLSRIDNSSDAAKVANKILDIFGEPFLINENRCTLGVSIGICLSSPEFVNSDNLMKNADKAMYAAKAQGRNMFMFFSADQL